MIKLSSPDIKFNKLEKLRETIDSRWIVEGSNTKKLEKKFKKKFKKNTNLVDKLNYDKFIRNTSINTTTMIILRSILRTSRFKKVNLEDYLFKCELLQDIRQISLERSI